MKQAVLMLAHGTPEKPENVPAYLRNVTSGRPLPEEVVKEVQHRYELIGQSPLTCWTYEQANKVSAELGMAVYVGMRNWKPYVSETVKQMSADGVTQCVAICMAPHNSRTSVGLYRRAVIGETGKAPFAVDFVESWHDEALLIDAFAERLRAGWKKATAEFGGPLPVIFTAHSVPTRTVEAGDPYETQARHTAELVAASVPEITGWEFAFQSQGMSGGAWLGPTVEETITGLADQGYKGVFVQPVGFVCDHVEVLYDIDIAFRRVAEERGMKLWRAESLNGSPLLAKAVAKIVRGRFAASNGAQSS